jgi:hypothetical protein
MKLHNPSRSPGFYLAQIPIAKKFSVRNQALEKPIRQPLSNPDELLQQLSSNLSSIQGFRPWP